MQLFSKCGPAETTASWMSVRVTEGLLPTWKEQGIPEIRLGLGAALRTSAADLDEPLGSTLTRLPDRSTSEEGTGI